MAYLCHVKVMTHQLTNKPLSIFWRTCHLLHGPKVTHESDTTTALKYNPPPLETIHMGS